MRRNFRQKNSQFNIGVIRSVFFIIVSIKQTMNFSPIRRNRFCLSITFLKIKCDMHMHVRVCICVHVYACECVWMCVCARHISCVKNRIKLSGVKFLLLNMWVLGISSGCETWLMLLFHWAIFMGPVWFLYTMKVAHCKSSEVKNPNTNWLLVASCRSKVVFLKFI